MSRKKYFGVLFVCLGNICRSPLGEAIFKNIVTEEGYESQINVDSAGTGNWHIGEPADSRMIQTALNHGIQITSTARQIKKIDFDKFKYIIAMDQDNHKNILNFGKEKARDCHIYLLREFDDHNNGNLNVPDPWYSGEEKFEEVFQIVDRSCKKLFKFVLEDKN